MKYFPYWITAVFFIFSLIGILNHEMWRDEYQAWMVAADAHSIPELFKNLKYEGNPVLWHAFLYVITAMTDNPFGMQLFHILISTAFIYLFNRYSPFPLIQKILFSFGFYTFFEFNLISRSYGLGLLLIMIFCILYKNRSKNLLYMGAVLFLLANDTIFGVILAVCFTGIVMLEGVFPGKNLKAPRISFLHLGLFAVIVAAGVIVGYLQIRPEPDNSFLNQYVTTYDPVRTNVALSRMVFAYFSFPDFSSLHFWNTNFFIPDEKKFPAAIGILLFLIWLVAFMRYRLILLLYGLGTLILLAFFYYTGLIWGRYAGHLFLLLLSCTWLAYYYKEQPFNINILNKVSLLGNKIRTPFFILILAIHFIGGIVAYSKDIMYPFSTSSLASDFIRDNKLTQYEILGTRDYVISPLASQLGKKMLYAESKDYGTFIIYDQFRHNIWQFKEVQDFIIEMVGNGHKRLILVKDVPILMTFTDSDEKIPWDEGMMTETLNLKLLKTIDAGIVHDEKYYIYSIDEVTPN